MMEADAVIAKIAYTAIMHSNILNATGTGIVITEYVTIAIEVCYLGKCWMDYLSSVTTCLKKEHVS